MAEKANKISHLEHVQATIIRMAGSSFLIKGWSVTLVSALIALAAAGSFKALVLLAFFPAIVFWILDGYYLGQERLFRALYDEVRKKNEEDIDFSMDTSKLASGGDKWFEALFSKTLLMFHGTVVLAIFAATYFYLQQAN